MEDYKINAKIKVFKNDVMIKMENMYPDRDLRERKKIKRGKIREFSYASRRRCRLALSNMQDNANVLITLTYPKEYPTNGKIVKDHIYKFKKFLRSNNIDYFWVLEFQLRGAPHFHFIVNSRLSYKLVAKVWYDIVGSNDIKHLQAGTRVELARHSRKARMYLLKYVEKNYSKVIPDEYLNVGRFWGHNKNMIVLLLDRSFKTTRYQFTRNLRVVKSWYNAQQRGWKYKQRFRSTEFVLWGGTRFYSYCFSLEGMRV